MGKQDDTHSCGICVMSAMDSVMFGRPHFTHAERYNLRVQYFIELTEYVAETVRKPGPNPYQREPTDTTRLDTCIQDQSDGGGNDPHWRSGIPNDRV